MSNIKISLFIFTVLTATLIGCKEEPAPAKGSIAGTVKEQGTDIPIPAAIVRIEDNGLNLETNTDGSYTITDLEAGKYSVTVSKTGYLTESRDVFVNPGITTPGDFLLVKNLPSASPEVIELNYSKRSETIELDNPGSDEMPFTTETSQTWLTVNHASGTIGSLGKLNIIVTADLESVPFGNYLETVKVIVGESSLTIPIEIVYAEPANITWKNWYLSVPIDNGLGKATSIFYQDIENDNLTAEEKEYFYMNVEDGSYTFFTKFTGFTTSGEYGLNESAYCRTELREFWQGNQSTDDNWYMTVGETHIMESTLKVDYCEGNERTFIAQIHGKSSTIPGVTNSPATVKVLWESGNLKIEYYIKPTGDVWTSGDIKKVTIGQVDFEKFTIKLKVQDGVFAYSLVCAAKGIDNDYVTLYDYAGNGYHYSNYFKTGNYFNFNSDYIQTAQTRLFGVTTFHE